MDVNKSAADAFTADCRNQSVGGKATKGLEATGGIVAIINDSVGIIIEAADVPTLRVKDLVIIDAADFGNGERRYGGEGDDLYKA